MGQPQIEPLPPAYINVCVETSPFDFLSSSTFRINTLPSPCRLHRHSTFIFKMRSFGFSLIATLLFGAISSAVPLPRPDGGLGDVVGGVDDVVEGVVDLLGGRAAQSPRGLAAIITDVTCKISPLIEQIGKFHVAVVCQAAY
jgi:hypothetical protein